MHSNYFLTVTNLTNLQFLEKLPLPTKLMLREIRKLVESGEFSKDNEPLRCLKKKLSLSRLFIEVEVSKKTKIDNTTLSRAKAAVEVAKIPCIELLEQIEDYKNETKSDVNEEAVCVKEALIELKPNSIFIKRFDEKDDFNETIDCSTVTEPLISEYKTQFETLYKSSKLTKCEIDEFVQLNDAVKANIFEDFLDDFVTLNETELERFINDTIKLSHKIANKRISCILTELPEHVVLR